MTLNRRHFIGGTSTALILSALPAFADAKGQKIAQDRYSRDRGWRDSTASARMTLLVPGRGQAVRNMTVKALETSGDSDMSITEFHSPRDLDGTQFLSHSHARKPDDQWLFLPARGKVRRVSSRNKSGAFLGSEFTFEDLNSFKVAKYSYEYAGQGSVAGKTCHILNQTPAYAHTGYSLVRVWLDSAELRPMKAEFHDRRGAHFKTMTFAKYRKYGRYWRAHDVTMSNLKNGRKTILTFDKITFRTGLSSDLFQPARLG